MNLNLTELLDDAARAKVQEESEYMKPDYDDLGLDEFKIHKRTTSSGKIKRIKRSQSAGEIVKRTGKSKVVRKKQARKLKKTLRKRGAGKIRMSNKKRARAMRKKGSK